MSKYDQLEDAVDIQDDVFPFYFGTHPCRLYGCYHKPQVTRDNTAAVILCQAIGQEYLQTHRVIYQLALLLSGAGFHVLRFDYSGCGDSEGEFEKGSIDRWAGDIHTAVVEIMQRCAQKRVYLIGLRMGATLAAKAASDCNQVAGVILWEPIVCGDRYLQELIDSQSDYLKYFPDQIGRDVESLMTEEIFGFPMTSRLRSELTAINSDNIKLPSGIRVLVISNNEDSRYVRDLNRITENQPDAKLQIIGDQSQVWIWNYRKNNPRKTLLYITEYLESMQV